MSVGYHFDEAAWFSAGRPGARFNPFPEPRSAKPHQLIGPELTAEEVGLAICAVSRTVTTWATNSLDLIESWRLDYESPAGQRERARRLASTLLSLVVPTELPPAAESSISGSWSWVPLPSPSALHLSRLVLLRPIPRPGTPETLVEAFPVVRGLGDRELAFAIVRRPLSKGRGRGWLFRRARIGTRFGTECLPSWIQRA